MEQRHFSDDEDDEDDESEPLTHNTDSEAHLKLMEEQFFWDTWTSRLEDATIPENYDGRRDQYMWTHFPVLMEAVCSTSDPDLSHLEWPHAFPQGPGPCESQNILPYNGLDENQNLQVRSKWLKRTSHCASRQPQSDDLFIHLFFPRSIVQQNSASSSYLSGFAISSNSQHPEPTLSAQTNNNDTEIDITASTNELQMSQLSTDAQNITR